MKEILLTQNQVAIVDDADYEELSKYKWCAWKNRRGVFYAVRNTCGRKGRLISMSRQILGLQYGDSRQADHINHNTLDNGQDNLRICTNQQNQRNRKSRLNSTSKYKGVCWDKNAKKWQAGLRINKKTRHLGLFLSEKAAALAYNIAAKKYFGKFAYLNVFA